MKKSVVVIDSVEYFTDEVIQPEEYQELLREMGSGENVQVPVEFYTELADMLGDLIYKCDYLEEVQYD